MPAMQTTTPTSISAAELMFLGSRCRILATSASTDGEYGLLDMIEVPAGNMPPLHIHHRHDEGFLLLEGELSLSCPNARLRSVAASSSSRRAEFHTPTRSETRRHGGLFSQHPPASSSSSKTSLRSTKSRQTR
jgi:hypothetical protein